LDARILSLLGEGYSSDEIAERLSMTPAAVRQRLSRLRRKLGKDLV
jgi:DNA-binding CsgD family transcriptional regulator